MAKHESDLKALEEKLTAVIQASLNGLQVAMRGELVEAKTQMSAQVSSERLDMLREMRESIEENLRAGRRMDEVQNGILPRVESRIDQSIKEVDDRLQEALASPRFKIESIRQEPEPVIKETRTTEHFPISSDAGGSPERPARADPLFDSDAAEELGTWAAGRKTASESAAPTGQESAAPAPPPGLQASESKPDWEKQKNVYERKMFDKRVAKLSGDSRPRRAPRSFEHGFSTFAR